MEVNSIADVQNPGQSVPRIFQRHTTNQAVDLVSLGQQQFRQVRPILTCNARDKCSFHPFSLIRIPSPVERSVFCRDGIAGLLRMSDKSATILIQRLCSGCYVAGTAIHHRYRELMVLKESSWNVRNG